MPRGVRPASDARMGSERGIQVGFYSEWWLAVYRAVWFPMHWWMGLESPGVPVPMLDESAPPIPGTTRPVAAKTCRPSTRRRQARQRPTAR